MSEDIPAGAAKVLAERIESLCEKMDGLREDIVELKHEVRGEVHDLESRVRRIEERIARDEGANYGARLTALADQKRLIEERLHVLEAQVARREPRPNRLAQYGKPVGLGAGAGTAIWALLEGLSALLRGAGKGG